MKYIDMNISSSALPVNVFLHWVTSLCVCRGVYVYVRFDFKGQCGGE